MVTLPSLPRHAESLCEAELLSMGMEGDHAALAHVRAAAAATVPVRVCRSTRRIAGIRLADKVCDGTRSEHLPCAAASRCPPLARPTTPMLPPPTFPQSTKERAMYLIEVWITSGHTPADVEAVQAKVHAAMQRMLPTTLPVQLSRQAHARSRLDMLGPAEADAADDAEAQQPSDTAHVQFSGVSIARRTEADIASTPAHDLPPEFSWKTRDHAACLAQAAS